MGWILLAIGGAVAARAAWILIKAGQRMESIRDELDDSMHTHREGDREESEPRN